MNRTHHRGGPDGPSRPAIVDELLRRAAARYAAPDRPTKARCYRDFLEQLETHRREHRGPRGRLIASSHPVVPPSRRTFERMLALIDRTRLHPDRVEPPVAVGRPSAPAGRTTASILMLPPLPRRHGPRSHRTHFRPRRAHG